MPGKTQSMCCITRFILLTGPFSAGPSWNPLTRVISLFNRAASSLSQRYWFSFLVWHTTITSLLKKLPVHCHDFNSNDCACQCVIVYSNVYITCSRVKVSTETVMAWTADAAMEPGCITQGGYGSEGESVEMDKLSSPTLQGLSVLCSTSKSWQKNLMNGLTRSLTVGNKARSQGLYQKLREMEK